METLENTLSKNIWENTLSKNIKVNFPPPHTGTTPIFGKPQVVPVCRGGSQIRNFGKPFIF